MLTIVDFTFFFIVNYLFSILVLLPFGKVGMGSFYNIPFVLGKIIFSTSLFTAILMDFAKALKIASILWCSFVPSALIFKLHFAPSVKDLKK